MNLRLSLSVLIILFLAAMFVSADDYLIIHTGDDEIRYNLAEIDSITFSTENGEREPGEEHEFPLTDDVNITMVWIPSGEFMMGAQDDEQDANDNERPRHRVTFDYGFWMGKYEVTQAQWEAVMGDWEFIFDGNPNRPAENVSHDDMNNDFIPALNENEDNSPWRLPSESEWEYACRSGHDETRYPWGNDPDYEQIGEYAWYEENSDSRTHDVGTKNPNDWNLYDMHGNVYEKCADVYHDNYNGAPQDGSPWGVGNGTKVMRGGSWPSPDRFCRSAYRAWQTPDDRGNSYGFRLVRDAADDD